MNNGRSSARPKARTALGVALLFAMVGRAPGAAGAVGPAPRMPAVRLVEVTPPSCGAASFPTVPFLDSLRVELASSALACCALVDPGGDAQTTAALRVGLELVPCSADAEKVDAAVRDLSDGRVVARAITLSDIAPPARPRALALAVAELIRALRQTARDAAPPPAAVAAESLPPSPPPPAGGHSPGLFLQVEGEARLVPTRSTTLWGGRVRLILPAGRLHADVDLGGGYASAGTDLGDVVLRTASLGLGGGPRLAARSAIIDLGLRAEVGWAWIRGAASAADVRTGSGSDVTASAGVRATVAFPARTSVRPSLGLEGGGVLRGVKGEASGRPVVGMTGYYWLAAIGIGVAP
jgi:hypothetical protein